jgi:hypothetical protein
MFIRGISVVIIVTVLIYEISAWNCPVDKPTTLIPNGEYKPRGKLTEAVGMTIYEVGPNTSTHLLIGIHDIFGVGPNTNCVEVSDILADGGFKVALPDFFHGEPWYSERGLPKLDRYVCSHPIF